jgi:uncharacterized protein with WD repeat
MGKKAIKIQHISDFEWSTSNNCVSYWVAEDKNVLARVVIMEIPSKNEIRSKVCAAIGYRWVFFFLREKCVSTILESGQCG